MQRNHGYEYKIIFEVFQFCFVGFKLFVILMTELMVKCGFLAALVFNSMVENFKIELI